MEINMTSRELFQNIMHYRDFARMPVFHWSGWGETHERWESEGLSKDTNHCEFFGAKPMPWTIPVNLDLFPQFEEENIEETDTYRIFRQGDGVIAQHWRNRSCIPHFIDFTLKDRSSWPEYQRRLQPDDRRLPEDLSATIESRFASDEIVVASTGSLVGWLRNWMGVQNFGVACCEDPAFIADVVETVSDLVCWSLDQVLPGIAIDAGWGWEDICFRNGPLVPPAVFQSAVLPGYKKIAEKLTAHGCNLYVVDCDGRIDSLLPLWLDAGVNVMFPIEIGPWNTDPIEYRRQYGKKLRIFGAIDKLVLERDHASIDREIELRKPLMAEGGYIPLPDHLITPGTSLDNYRYYLDCLRALRF